MQLQFLGYFRIVEGITLWLQLDSTVGTIPAEDTVDLVVAEDTKVWVDTEGTVGAVGWCFM